MSHLNKMEIIFGKTFFSNFFLLAKKLIINKFNLKESKNDKNRVNE